MYECISSAFIHIFFLHLSSSTNHLLFFLVLKMLYSLTFLRSVIYGKKQNQYHTQSTLYTGHVYFCTARWSFKTASSKCSISENKKKPKTTPLYRYVIIIYVVTPRGSILFTFWPNSFPIDYLEPFADAVPLRCSPWADTILEFLVGAESVGLPTILDLVNRSTVQRQKLLVYKTAASTRAGGQHTRRRSYCKNTSTRSKRHALLYANRMSTQTTKS